MGTGFGGTRAPSAPPRAQVAFIEASWDTKQKATVTAANGLAVEGLWCFTLGPLKKVRGAAALTALRRAYLAEVEFRRYKVGLKIKQAQAVDQFAFRGTTAWFQMVPDVAVTNSLTQLFPTDPGDKWVGFTPPAGYRRRPRWRQGLTVCYQYKLALSPLPAPPQAVVSLITYDDLPFNQHHLKSVLLLSDGEKRIRTATRALVP